MFFCHAACPGYARSPLLMSPSLSRLTGGSLPIRLAKFRQGYRRTWTQACGWYWSWAALLLDQRFFRHIVDRDQRLRVIGAAVAIEEVIDVGAGALQSAIARRNVRFQLIHTVGRFGALVDLHPNAGLLGDHLALAVGSAAAGPVAHVLRARHRANVLHQPQNAIAARLASKDRLLESQLGLFQSMCSSGALVDPTQDARQHRAQRGRSVGGLDDIEELLRELARL